MKTLSVLIAGFTFGFASAYVSVSADPPFVVIDSSRGQQVTVYFDGWLYQSVSGPLPPQATRSHHQMLLQSKDADYATRLLEWLGVESLTSNPLRDEKGKPMFGSALLVVDVTDHDNVVRTYFSDGCFLYGDGGATRTRVDAAFRDRFSFDSTEAFDEEFRCGSWFRARKISHTRSN